MNVSRFIIFYNLVLSTTYFNNESHCVTTSQYQEKIEKYELAINTIKDQLDIFKDSENSDVKVMSKSILGIIKMIQK